MRFRSTVQALIAIALAGSAHAQFASLDSAPAEVLPANVPAQIVNSQVTPTLGFTSAAAPASSGHFVWMTADYSLNWMTRTTLPPLVTSSPIGVAQANAGVLGLASTNLLLGQDTLESPCTSGIRATLGIGAPEGMRYEVSGLCIRDNVASFNAGGDGSSASIARPFFEPITGQEATELVSFPGRFAGSIDVALRSTLVGVEVSALDQFDMGVPLTIIAGFRYLQLEDDLSIVHNTTALNAPALTFGGSNIALNNSLQITDIFRTRNQFIGPQIGIRSERVFGSLIFGIDAKIAMGSNRQTVFINGQSDQLANGTAVRTTPGGFLASLTNIGSFHQQKLNCIPELSLKLGYEVTPSLRTFIGYDCLAWSGVVRAGDQIDRTVNLTQIPTAAIFSPSFGGPPRPTFEFRMSDLVVHSLRIGVEWNY